MSATPETVIADFRAVEAKAEVACALSALLAGYVDGDFAGDSQVWDEHAQVVAKHLAELTGSIHNDLAEAGLAATFMRPDADTRTKLLAIFDGLTSDQKFVFVERCKEAFRAVPAGDDIALEEALVATRGILDGLEWTAPSQEAA